MADPTNPEWRFVDLFWDMLEAETLFTNAVAADSRIKYTDLTKRTIEPDGGHAADYPRVRVRKTGSRPRAYRTSNSSCIIINWAVDIESGDRRMSTEDANKFADVKFAIYKSLSRWKTYLSSFTWGDNTAGVSRFVSKETQDVIGPNRGSRSPIGWTSVWQGEAELWFTTSDIVST